MYNIIEERWLRESDKAEQKILEKNKKEKIVAIVVMSTIYSLPERKRSRTR